MFAMMKTGSEQTRYFTLNHVHILIILNLPLIHGRNHYANAECVDRKSNLYHIQSMLYLCSYYYMLTMLIYGNIFFS